MKQKYGFRYSQDILRVLFYMGAGMGMAEFRWYFSLPLAFLLFFLAGIIENVNTEIRQLNQTEKR